MGIDFVSRAVQIPFSSGLAVHSVFTDPASLFERIGKAAENMLPNALYFSDELWTFPQSLAGRAVLLTAIGLSLASFIARSKAHPPQSSDSNNSPHVYFTAAISSLRACGVALWAWFSGDNFFLCTCAIDSVVQFKNAFTVLPDLNGPPSEPSQFKQVIQVACKVAKYVVFTGLAIVVFRDCNKEMFNGALYFLIGYGIGVSANLRLRAKAISKENVENCRCLIEEALGSHIAMLLITAAIASGIGGSLLYTGGLSCISGVLNRNVYDCLYGVRNMSLAALILPFIKERVYEQHHLDQYAHGFIQRFNVAIYRAEELAERLKLKLSEGYFHNAFFLAYGYSVPKNYPGQKPYIIATLKSIPAGERLFYLYQNQSFLDEQEMQEFVKTCEIQAWDIWFYLHPRQFQRLFLPKTIAPFLNPNGLKEMQAEVEGLKRELMEAIERCADLEKEQRELQIYEKIQQKQKEIVEYSSSIAALNDILGKIDPEAAFSLDMKQYAKQLKELIPQIVSLNREIVELETLIEEHTGNLTLSVSEAVGGKGFCVRDCEDIFERLQLPHSSLPFETLSQMLAERGCKNQYDLVKKGILVRADTVEGLKERLIDFLLRSDQSMPVPVRDSVQAPSAVMKIARVSEKIYKCVAIPFFFALQFYAQPGWSLAGVVVGTASAFFMGNNGAVRAYQNVLVFPDRILVNPIEIKWLHVFLSAQLTMAFFTRFGFIPALLLGSGFPLRCYLFLNIAHRALH